MNFGLKLVKMSLLLNNVINQTVFCFTIINSCAVYSYEIEDNYL